MADVAKKRYRDDLEKVGVQIVIRTCEWMSKYDRSWGRLKLPILLPVDESKRLSDLRYRP